MNIRNVGSLLNAFRVTKTLPRGSSRTMVSVNDSIPHTVRTANDPRQMGLYNATLSHIEQVPLRHLPGQWLDVHIPQIPQAGGFTITSPPSTCLPSSTSAEPPYLELAIQSSHNPPALFFHQPASTILHTPLDVRVGGRFVYPPPDLSYEECRRLDRAVFVAGGVGVNPVMSMVSAIHSLGFGKVGGMMRQMRVLHGTKAEEDGEILFYNRLSKIARYWESVEDVDYQFTLFETGGKVAAQDSQKEYTQDSGVRQESRRITHADLIEAMGPEDDRTNTVVYVCGPPQMTDEFIAILQKAPGMENRRVLCEKWW